MWPGRPGGSSQNPFQCTVTVCVEYMPNLKLPSSASLYIVSFGDRNVNSTRVPVSRLF
jgi:hypothetical protein